MVLSNELALVAPTLSMGKQTSLVDSEATDLTLHKTSWLLRQKKKAQISHRVARASSAVLPSSDHASLKTRIFISPHPDDIAYSCYASISQEIRESQSEDGDSISKGRDHENDDGYRDFVEAGGARSRTDCVVVTVFNKSRCANGELGEKLGHDVETVSPVRQAEDEAFAESMGCRLISLGFGDTSARDEPSRRLGALAANEEEMEKMTKAHVAYSSVEQHLEAIIRWAVECEAEIYLPLGVGCHIDHWITRVAVTSLLGRIRRERKRSSRHSSRLSTAVHDHSRIPTKTMSARTSRVKLNFYEDMPYAFYASPGHIDSLVDCVLSGLNCEAIAQADTLVTLDREAWERKKNAILLYATQMKPSILGCMDARASALASKSGSRDEQVWAERVWKVALVI